MRTYHSHSKDSTLKSYRVTMYSLFRTNHVTRMPSVSFSFSWAEFPGFAGPRRHESCANVVSGDFIDQQTLHLATDLLKCQTIGKNRDRADRMACALTNAFPSFLVTISSGTATKLATISSERSTMHATASGSSTILLQCFD